jgi:polar amino acid transport system substrate-binding protein
MMGKRVRAVVLGAVVSLAAGCGATGTPVDPAPVHSVERPAPVGVVVSPPPPTGQATPPSSCDPTVSLSPTDLPPAGQMPDWSTMRRIQDRGRLIAGVDQNTYLFGFRDPSTNALEGFDIDRVREVAAAIFGDPDKVQYKVISSAERIPALERGEVDIVVRTMTATCDRWQKINFSAIYYVAGQRLLVDKGSSVTSLDELGNKWVCAARGSTSIAKIAQHPSKPIPVATDTWSDCLVMLQQGQVVAVSTDDTILAGMAAQDPNVKMAGPRFTEEPYGIGVPKANEDMVRFVNAVLEKSVRDGAWAESYAQWLGRTTREPASPPTPKYRG